MALTSTLGSPGVEIREIDNSLRLDTSTGTTVYIPGFAAQGPVDEVMSIGSISDFETIYGVPSNSAERYFYYTVKSILDNTSGGTTVLCTRLPYGDDSGDTISNQYTMMAYPAIPVVKQKYTKYTKGEKWFIWNEDKHTNSDKEGATPSEFSYNFDQFVLTESEHEDALIQAFSVAKTVSVNVDDGTDILVNDEPYIPELDSCTLTLDDDLTDCETIRIVQIGTTSTIPAEGTTVDLTKFDTDSSKITAPEIRLNYIQNGKSKADVELKAEGFMATESVVNEETKETTTFLHLSYNIKLEEKNNPNSSRNGLVVGSMYLKFRYDKVTAEDIAGFVIAGLTESTEENLIDFSLVHSHVIADDYTGYGIEEEITYIVGSPVTYQVSLNEYYRILTGETLKWENEPFVFGGLNTSINAQDDENKTSDTEANSGKFGHFDAIGRAAFIVLNTARTIINNKFEGFYIGLTDNSYITSTDDEFVFNAVDSVKTTTYTYDAVEDLNVGLRDTISSSCDYNPLHPSRLSCKLADNSNGSISKILARDITANDISGRAYDDTISLGLFKMSITSEDSDVVKLNCSLKEKYNWSIGKSRMKSAQSSTKPVSYFAEDIVTDSNNLTIMVNTNISSHDKTNGDGEPYAKIRIFGNKLLSNLERSEKRYLRHVITEVPTSSSAPVDAKQFATLAISNIKEWENEVAAAGVTPTFIKKHFKGYSVTTNDKASITDEYGRFQPLNSLLPFGAYDGADSTSKSIGEVPAKLERALSLVENDEMYPDIDLVLESGLGTVYINAKGDLDENGETTAAGSFDDAVVLKGLEDLRTGRNTVSDLGQNVKENYNAVQNVFLQFANSYQNGGRGDCFYISDIPRGILIKGKDTKITTLFGKKMEGTSYELGESVNHSFPTSIYYPIKHTFDNIVSSYMSTYAQWVKILDKHSAKKIWIPISGYIAANMCATDTVYGPWYAAAGLRRGVINGVLDYAISPNVSQRTDLYKICINSVPKIPNYGVTIWGIRTMSKAATAFDQNTCRRTFLYMQKKVKQLLRFYLFEPNNSFTRLQIFNDIDPFLEGIKNSGGVYAYTLTCDTTINTPEVINNGDLAIRIAAAPTRTAENIVVEFVANKYTEEIAASEG